MASKPTVGRRVAYVDDSGAGDMVIGRVVPSTGQGPPGSVCVALERPRTPVVWFSPDEAHRLRVLDGADESLPGKESER